MLAGAIRTCLRLASGRDKKVRFSATHPPFPTFQPSYFRVIFRLSKRTWTTAFRPFWRRRIRDRPVTEELLARTPAAWVADAKRMADIFSERTVGQMSEHCELVSRLSGVDGADSDPIANTQLIEFKCVQRLRENFGRFVRTLEFVPLQIGRR